jgi:hypothetical protein
VTLVWTPGYDDGSTYTPGKVVLKKDSVAASLYPGAAAAYSLRSLTVGNSTVVRVRRSSDNTEQDFTAAQVTDGTLTTFCGAGDGFVRTWYDQSENGLHLTQTTTGNQPQIVTSGVLETEGSKPCIKHTAATNRLTVSTSYSSNFHSVFKVVRVTGTTGQHRILSIVGEQAIFRKNDTQFQMYGAGVVLSLSGSFPTTRVLLSGIWLHAEGDIFGYSNGANVVTNTAGSGATASPTLYDVGGVPTEGFLGNVQEIIIYRSNQTANRTAIESTINTHYAIY